MFYIMLRNHKSIFAISMSLFLMQCKKILDPKTKEDKHHHHNANMPIAITKTSLDAKLYSLIQQQWATNLERPYPYNTMHTLRWQFQHHKHSHSLKKSCGGRCTLQVLLQTSLQLQWGC